MIRKPMIMKKSIWNLEDVKIVHKLMKVWMIAYPANLNALKKILISGNGNKIIDKLTQDNQLSTKRYGLLEWVPYNKFTDIKYLAEGGFAKVYSAIWIDGRIKRWSQLSNDWRRSGLLTIALKMLNYSENISEDFLNEVCKK